VAHGESGGERREVAGPWLPKRARTWRLLLHLEHRRCSRGDDGTQQQHAPCSGVDSRRRVLVRCKGGRDTEELPAGTNPCSGRWPPGIRGRRRRRFGPPLPVDGNSPVRGAGSRYQTSHRRTQARDHLTLGRDAVHKARLALPLLIHPPSPSSCHK
jgi:hypothetical protein